MKRLVSVIGFLPILLYAQVADSIMLSPVHISSDRFYQFSSGQKVVSFDSVSRNRYQSQTISDLLSEQSQVFIKSYGPGNIATPSFRGTGPEHTALLWNGINIQSPMLGQADLSILPVNSSSRIDIAYGGNGALYGSGSIGGAVLLNAIPQFQSGLQVHGYTTYASFGTVRAGVEMHTGGRKLSHDLHVNAVNAENNILYKNTALAGSPEQRLPHAQMKVYQLNGDLFVAGPRHSEWFVHYWTHYAQRMIPPVIGVAASHAVQTDGAIRLLTGWKQERYERHIETRIAIIRDRLDYTDSLFLIHAKSVCWNLVAEAEYRRTFWKQLTLSAAVSGNRSSATTETYSDQSLNRFSQLFMAHYESPAHQLHLSMNLRNEWFNGQLIPLMPSFGGSWQPHATTTFSVLISRSYRNPTLNERYWNPGGNPALQPETGWGQEATIAYRKAGLKLSLQTALTAFNRNMHNWILWSPDTGFWSVNNVLTVQNYGMEGSFRLNWQPESKWLITWQSMISACQSLVSSKPGNYQLPYIPRITQQHSIRISKPRWQCTLSSTYTGMRFTTYDQSSYLGDYLLVHLLCSVVPIASRSPFQIQFGSNNLLNTDYFIIPGRPMPGRAFHIGLHFTIINKHNPS